MMRTETETAVLLQKSFLFRHLTVEETVELLDTLDPPQTVRKGETVYEPAVFCHALVVVLQGKLQVLSGSGGGKRTILNLLSAGDICGATAVFGEQESFVTEITAVQDSILLYVRQQHLSDWFARYPIVAENYIRFLTDRICFLNKKIATYTGGQADDRLWRYFCDHCDETGRVTLAGSISDLARTLDIGRSSIYRSLEGLEADGKICRNGKTIQLLSIY